MGLPQDEERLVSFFFKIPSSEADMFNALAVERFGMKKGAKRQMFLAMLDEHIRARKIEKLKDEISMLENDKGRVSDWSRATSFQPSTAKMTWGEERIADQSSS